MVAMSAKKATLNKRVIGFARRLFPARRVRTIGMRMTMNAVGKSHNVPNNRIRPGALWLVMGLFRDSRIANGSTRIKLMSAADFEFIAVLFVGSSFCRTFRNCKSPLLKMML